MEGGCLESYQERDGGIPHLQSPLIHEYLDYVYVQMWACSRTEHWLRNITHPLFRMQSTKIWTSQNSSRKTMRTKRALMDFCREKSKLFILNQPYWEDIRKRNRGGNVREQKELIIWWVIETFFFWSEFYHKILWGLRRLWDFRLAKVFGRRKWKRRNENAYKYKRKQQSERRNGMSYQFSVRGTIVSYHTIQAFSRSKNQPWPKDIHLRF